MIPRRDFLRSLPLISLAPTVPGFLARSARAASPEKDARVLVVVQLDGGNDGVNTVVPHADEGYSRHRKALKLESGRLIRVTDGVGLHPAMGGAGQLLESGRLAIVPGVGYPNPNRSHFESMAIWQTARLDPEEHAGPGWLGRALDGSSGRDPSLFLGKGTPPSAVRGRRVSASAIDRIDDLKLDPDLARPEVSPGGDDLAAFVRRSTLDAYAGADRLAELARDDSSARYPSTALAERLKLVARLLKGGYASRVFYTNQGGYDTHAGQAGTHFQLLAELSGALKAFLDDLEAARLADRVLVLCFSEFGRRVAENGSAGTDHGTAGPVLLAGPGVRPGLLGAYPSLDDLDGGDLKSAVDFRRVYATALEGWLGLPSVAALGGEFATFPLLRG